VLVPPVVACSSPAAEERATPSAAAIGATAPAVVAISVDGLNVEAIDRLGQSGAPTLHRLLDEGLGTLNARTEHELTITLPNHTGMVTGRRIRASQGGHGVTWNDDRAGTTVQRAAGHPVRSVFSQVHAAGGDTALYTTKTKFSLFTRSWPRAVDTFRVKENQRRLVRMARRDLTGTPPTFTFLHVSLPDRFGHEYGGMSPEYLDAVRRTDAQLGTVLRAVQDEDVVVILTADHGFATGETEHSVKRDIENFRIPFVVWGAGIEPGDLYDLNPDFRDPRNRRTSYDPERQPVRNGNVANLALDLLGLAGVPGSEFDREQRLTVTR
jgi:predicted AlkP superfamily pyrophosphatase or phosphodiesterase